MTHGAPVTRTFTTPITRVVSLLSETHPTSESDLLGLLYGEGLTREQALEAIALAQARNEIRWVAFQGWCKGGRP